MYKLSVSEFYTLVLTTRFHTYVSDIPATYREIVQDLLDVDPNTKEGVVCNFTAKHALRNSARDRKRRLVANNLDVNTEPQDHIQYAHDKVYCQI